MKTNDIVLVNNKGFEDFFVLKVPKEKYKTLDTEFWYGFLVSDPTKTIVFPVLPENRIH